MSKKASFNLEEAHKHFSVSCFNSAWDLIEKESRSPEEDQEMIRLNQSSIWHWTQREDCTAKNLSIGYWQASRIYAILDQVENARRYGQLSMKISQKERPFYIAYAHEALARAENLAGNEKQANAHLEKARKLADVILEEDEKKALLDDLATIG